MKISSTMKQPLTLAALVGGLFTASAIAPRALEAQQKQHVQPMEVYVLGKDTVHVGVGAVPRSGPLAKIDKSSGRTIYLGDARLIDANGGAVTLRAAEGDRIAFVARSAQGEHGIRAPRLDVDYENLTINGEQVRAAVVSAADLYAQSRGHPVLRMTRGNEGVALAFNMNYAGTEVAARDTRLRTRPDISIPIRGKDYVPPAPAPPDTVRLPPDTVTITVTPPPIKLPPDTIIRTISPPTRPVHAQLDLGPAYMRERTTTPTLDALFRSWGFVGNAVYSDDKVFANARAGTFGNFIFKGDYTENVGTDRKEGDASRHFLSGMALVGIGKPFAVGVGADYDRFNSDTSFVRGTEEDTYVNARAGLKFNNAKSYGQLTAGAGRMFVDGNKIIPVSGPAWDVGTKLVFMPSRSTEFGVHGNFRSYDNLTGQTCCTTVDMDGERWMAGAHLKTALFGSNTVRPIIGGDIWHDQYTGTNVDPRKGWMLWGGLGISLGREAQPEIVATRTIRAASAAQQGDTAKSYLGPQMRPSGVTRNYHR